MKYTEQEGNNEANEDIAAILGGVLMGIVFAALIVYGI